MTQPSTALIQYAREHRDPRNIALHCWGVPMVWAGLAWILVERMNPMPWALLLTGSLLQALGHVYEGRRATLGLASWLMAPWFVGLQGLHGLGLGQRRWAALEQQAGPRRMRDLAL
jgi:uncharacterized membrane protein YGL010W